MFPVWEYLRRQRCLGDSPQAQPFVETEGSFDGICAVPSLDSNLTCEASVEFSICGTVLVLTNFQSVAQIGSQMFGLATLDSFSPSFFLSVCLALWLKGLSPKYMQMFMIENR